MAAARGPVAKPTKAVLAGRPIWEYRTIAKWLAGRRGVGRPPKTKR